MSDYVNVTELFGCDVFNDSVMQDRLPKKVYKELKKTIEEGKELSMEVADVVAHEMKEWAIEKGADSLQSLVSAPYRRNCREARCIYHRTYGEWKSPSELFW